MSNQLSSTGLCVDAKCISCQSLTFYRYTHIFSIELLRMHICNSTIQQTPTPPPPLFQIRPSLHLHHLSQHNNSHLVSTRTEIPCYAQFDHNRRCCSRLSWRQACHMKARSFVIADLHENTSNHSK